MKRLRIYIDTSVVGGCLDDEFTAQSTALFERCRAGEVTLLISTVLLEELQRAPEHVKMLIADLPAEHLESVDPTLEAAQLRDAYLAARVVGPGSANDALHVALATVARADLIVSWNFKHIVHFERIRRFNAVNLQEAYPPIEIRSPREVV